MCYSLFCSTPLCYVTLYYTTLHDALFHIYAGVVYSGKSCSRHNAVQVCGFRTFSVEAVATLDLVRTRHSPNCFTIRLLPRGKTSC